MPGSLGSYEVAGWDGRRWRPEGVFRSGGEAAAKAKQVLGSRLGVRVTQAPAGSSAGGARARVLFEEYRDPAVDRHPVRPPAAAGTGPIAAAGARSGEMAMMIAIASLVVSIVTLVLALLR